MKQFIKSLIVGGALVAASASQAAIVNINVYDDAPAAETAFLASLYNITTEDFETYQLDGSDDGGLTPGQITPGNQQLSWVDSAVSYSTSVGTFTLVTPGISSGTGDPIDELKIENKSTGEYGREVASGNWLDSNDARTVTWDISLGGASFNALGFYLMDANDQGARLTLILSNGLMQSYDFNTALPNGNQKFVTIVSDTSVVGATLTFDNGHGRDGWGIDNVSVGTVPEPGTLLLMGLGLLGLGAARRRTAA